MKMDAGFSEPPNWVFVTGALGEGQPYKLIIGGTEHDRAVALSDTLAELELGAFRVVRVGNALRTPLSLERVLIQIGSSAPIGAADASQDDDTAQIRMALHERQGDETRVVLVVDQAETLTPDAFSFLSDLSAGEPADAQSDRELTLSVVFLGTAALWELLENDSVSGLRQQLAQQVPEPARLERARGNVDQARAAKPDPAPIAQNAGYADGSPGKPRSKRGMLLAGLIAILIVAVVGAVVLQPTLFSDQVSPAIPSPAPVADAVPPEPASPQPPPPEAQAVSPESETPAMPPPELAVPPPAGRSATPTAENYARLRREFDLFLAEAGPSTAKMTSAQRQRLFQEYLDRRAK